ncbi:exported hypothetical protein [Magnetospirillum sp. LM-5]|uniref:LamG domain-containing protein n=1 Tax=Magnetospirillum sp. LM-5 TaxID=2681466 RepID=UPI00137F03FC|nr:LamG domain-containing protein [Magnetospirillum sp. LM-5]CAA7626020.1 exported hypothetical protein [Magnetospirillum sp. LM-5]
MRFVVWLLAVSLFAATGSGALAHRLADDLWAYWPLTNDSFDASPRELHGTGRGAVTIEPTAGPFTGSTRFDGGWIEIPPNDTADFADFAISAWIKYDSAGTDFTPIIGRLGLVGRRGALAYDLGDGTTPQLLTTDITPQWKRWAHFALTHDAASRTLILWVNGWKTFERQLPAVSVAPAPFSGRYGLGGGPGIKSTFRGEIADVVIYRRSLSPDEISLFSQGVGRTTRPQIGISQGCGGSGQPPCQVCARHAEWPPAQWAECTPARVPWCAGFAQANQHATCP